MPKEFISPDRTAYTRSGKTVRFRIELDQNELIRMADRARHNKNGKAKQGPCTVTVLNLDEIRET